MHAIRFNPPAWLRSVSYAFLKDSLRCARLPPFPLSPCTCIRACMRSCASARGWSNLSQPGSSARACGGLPAVQTMSQEDKDGKLCWTRDVLQVKQKWVIVVVVVSSSSSSISEYKDGELCWPRVSWGRCGGQQRATNTITKTKTKTKTRTEIKTKTNHGNQY